MNLPLSLILRTRLSLEYLKVMFLPILPLVQRPFMGAVLFSPKPVA